MAEANNIASSITVVLVQSGAVALTLLILLMDAAAFLFWLMVGIFGDKSTSDIAVPVFFVCLIVSFLALLFVCALFGLAKRLSEAAKSNEKVRVLSDFGQLIDGGWETGLQTSMNCGVIILGLLVLFALAFWKDLLWWSSFCRGTQAASLHHLEESRTYYQRAVEAATTADKDRLAVSQFLVASNSVEQKNYGDAIREFKLGLYTLSQQPGDHRALEIHAHQGLARSLIEQGNYDEAVQAMKHCIDLFHQSDKPLEPVRLRLIGPVSAPSAGKDSGPTLAGCYSLLEEAYAKQGKFKECQEAFDTNIEQFDKAKDVTALQLMRLVEIYTELLSQTKPPQYEMIEKAFAQGEKLMIQHFGESSIELFVFEIAYGDKEKDLQRFPQAERIYKKALAQSKLKEDHPLVLRVMASLASLYADMGDNKQAETLFKQTLAAYEAKKDKSPDAQIPLDACRAAYVKFLKKLGREEDAKKLEGTKASETPQTKEEKQE